MIKIDIHDDGEHWHKTVKILGITVYHRHDYTKNNEPRPIGFTSMAQFQARLRTRNIGPKKRNDMEEKDILYIKNPSANLGLKADNSVLVLNMHELLELQEKYTTLQCECKRFADWVLNMSHDRCAIAIKFDNEYLSIAGNTMSNLIGRIPNHDPEEIIKEIKK